MAGRGVAIRGRPIRGALWARLQVTNLPHMQIDNLGHKQVTNLPHKLRCGISI
jgi:hypothetical protein